MPPCPWDDPLRATQDALGVGRWRWGLVQRWLGLVSSGPPSRWTGGSLPPAPALHPPPPSLLNPSDCHSMTLGKVLNTTDPFPIPKPTVVTVSTLLSISFQAHSFWVPYPPWGSDLNRIQPLAGPGPWLVPPSAGGASVQGLGCRWASAG